MNESAIPLFARWSVAALGDTVGDPRQARDTVAAWLLNHHPELRPKAPDPSRLARLRSTTALVDELVAEEVSRAKQAGESLAYWAVGAAFDARWYRLLPILAGTVRKHVEVEVPPLLRLKTRLLGASRFDSVWSSIEKRALPEQEWGIEASHGLVPLVILEGLWWRLSPAVLEQLLRRIVTDAPGARVLLDLPGEGVKVEGPWWPNSYLRDLGFVVDLDRRLTKRHRLKIKRNGTVCGGMESSRIVRLTAPLPR